MRLNSGLSFAAGIALAAALASCTAQQLAEADDGAHAILALCSIAPAISNDANRLQAISDKCAAANVVLAGAELATPYVLNLVSPRAVKDQASDIVAAKSAG